MAKITLKNLAHRYSKSAEQALKPMDHVWEDGMAYALLGPSGCGKSTLLNIISGLLTPSAGQVFFDDIDVTSERNIAQVFQFPVVYDTMTVGENLAFPLKNRGHSQTRIMNRVAEIADMIGLSDILTIRASGLSADLQQKISLGRGMVREDVNAILFDEPLTVIDPAMKWQLRAQLKELHLKLAHTMIYVTHDQTEALTFADKVVVMNQGEVLQIGTPTELFEAPAHTFVGNFIGSPGMNIFKAHINAGKIQIGEKTVNLPDQSSDLRGEFEIGIRPEYCSLSDKASDIAISIDRVEDVGRHKIVRATLNGSAINIIVNESSEISENMKYVHFDVAKINVYQDSWRVAP
jgi:glycerol transport system ATP-binding protein